MYYTSYSAITQHRTCPQAWTYKRINRLTEAGDGSSIELQYGNWWHLLMAADSVERGSRAGTLRYAPEMLTSIDLPATYTAEERADHPSTLVLPGASLYWEERNKLLASGNHTNVVLSNALAWFAGLPALVQDAWVERLGASLPELLGKSYARWLYRWAEERKNEQPLAVELPWERALPSLGGHDPETTLTGYIDEVYLDTKRNISVVRDHKTAKTLSAASSTDDMLDSQLQMYAWAAAPTVASWGVAKLVAVGYDRARSSAPKTPQVTSAGTLSKSVTDYDAATYGDWARGPDGEGVPWGKPGEYYATGAKKGQPKFGNYTLEEAVLVKLSDPAALSVWNQRTLVPLNGNVIKAHLRSAVLSAIDAKRTRERAGVSGLGEVGRNFGRACTWCPYSLLCAAELRGGKGGEYDLEAMGLRRKEASEAGGRR